VPRPRARAQLTVAATKPWADHFCAPDQVSTTLKPDCSSWRVTHVSGNSRYVLQVAGWEAGQAAGALAGR
jgi:hypothetical protein